MKKMSIFWCIVIGVLISLTSPTMVCAPLPGISCTLGTQQLLTTDPKDIDKLGLHPRQVIKVDTLGDPDGQKVYRFYYRP